MLSPTRPAQQANRRTCLVAFGMRAVSQPEPGDFTDPDVSQRALTVSVPVRELFPKSTTSPELVPFSGGIRNLRPVNEKCAQ
jgi:hypothetical protein